MMNKEIFLSELRGYLSILEKQEQEDILAEYVQHIDMKMQKGLSEEEAIRDFGSMEELAAEILEAYHVNFDSVVKLPGRRTRPSLLHKSGMRPVQGEFGRSGADSGLPVQGIRSADSKEPVWRRGLRWIGKMTAKIRQGAGRGWRWLCSKWRAAAAWLKKLFTGRKVENTKESGLYMEETGKERGRIRTGCRTIGNGIVLLWRWMIRFCVFCLKFMWNAGWFLFSLMCAGMALIILMGVGAIPVFLIQGYPFAGIFLMCLGGFLCSGALSWGAFSMMIRKEKKKQTGETGKDDEEVQYEQTA